MEASEGELAVVDLKSAYLQIKVAKHLWQSQLVKFEEKTYCLTRLGFRLNCVRKIRTKILRSVLRKVKS